jgi:O-succinylbenzoic acid--CoA ligase
MGSTMKNKIHTIEVENNETQSVEKIIEKIRENKIIYVKKQILSRQRCIRFNY